MKVIKKSLAILLAMIILVCYLPVTTLAEVIRDTGNEQSGEIDVKTIEIGDYISLGTYLGEPIIWRCVDIDENGPLMLSEKILCFKSFDASGGHSNYYRNNCGTNNWKDSCIRRWLNTSGTVDWSQGITIPSSENLINGYNPYDEEEGFLSNFSESELEYIKQVTIKTNINEKDSIYADGGSGEYCEVNGEFSQVFANSETMGEGKMYQNTTDYFFFLNYKQAGRVYRNLGSSALAAYPTSSAVKYDDSQGTSVKSTYGYWMRDPATSGMSYECVQVIAYNRVDTVTGVSTTNLVNYQHMGVRPAFYLNLDNYEGGYIGNFILDKYRADLYLKEGINVQMNDENNLEELTNQVIKDTNDVMSNAKSWVTTAELIDSNVIGLEVVSGKTKLKSLSDRDKSVFSEYLSKKFKENHPKLNTSADITKLLTYIFGIVDTFREAVEIIEVLTGNSTMLEELRSTGTN